MAVVVEDGTGKSDAEVYLSLIEADAYWAKHGNPTTWTNLSDNQKEEGMRMGAQYLDLRYGDQWKGVRKETDQALAWPRTGVIDYDNKAIDDDAVPVKIKYANAEAAHRHHTETDGLIPDIEDPGAIKEETLKAGPAMLSTEWLGGNPQVDQFRKIDLLVSDLIKPAGEIERG